MVCSHCNCSGHNARTCQFLITSPAEKRVADELGAMLPTARAPVDQVEAQRLVEVEVRRLYDACWRLAEEPKKVTKTLEGLAECANIFKEPKVVKAKKVTKTLEGLADCANIFKEPKVVKAKKVSKHLEGLIGCLNIFKEPKVVKVKKHLKTCSACGEKGHNSRTCVNVCHPCPSPQEIASK